MGALHLLVKTGFEVMSLINRTHHLQINSYNYLLDMFLNPDLSRLSLEEANTAMAGLRKYPENGEPVFQSYHSAYDSDHHNFFPSGTVGNSAGQCVAIWHWLIATPENMAMRVPDAHFWAVCGDSEFREGSLYEAVPDFAEREINNLTWIVDYNRQSLDGSRISNKEIMDGSDADRIGRTMAANGWEVIQLRHGKKRLELFKKPGGEVFKNFLENELEDFEFQALLLVARHEGSEKRDR